MFHLRTRTEFSFRRAYGRIGDIIDATEGPLAITDMGSTWGHVKFWKAMKKVDRKPILGVELQIVPDATARERSQGYQAVLLAKNKIGLKEIYALNTRANHEGFYYNPRAQLDWIEECENCVIILVGNLDSTPLEFVQERQGAFLGITPASTLAHVRMATKIGPEKVVAVGDNHMIRPSDREIYNLHTERNAVQRTTMLHILDEDEFRLIHDQLPETAFTNSEAIADMIELDELPQAQMAKFEPEKTIEEMCRDGISKLGVEWNQDYEDRLRREIDLIQEKRFEDYFYIIADIIQYAKTKMLVGPARGSSAGSLVCFLLEITSVDPIIHGTMFERFIDINRADLPDIDIDFQDDKRHLVFEYLEKKYGHGRVGHIGNVVSYKPKSAINAVAKGLKIPIAEVEDLKGAIIERSSGDARAQFSILDTFNELEIGQKMIEKYPDLALAAKIEGHAQHTSQHAAGMMVTEEELINYCSIDHSGAAQIDKKDAEDLNILKIDALGLRTLSVIDECLGMIGKSYDWIMNYPLDDDEAFKIFQEERYAGIFQFEGYACQVLCRQMGVDRFSDVSALTALARPGPLHGGGAAEFVARRTGAEAITYPHPSAIESTEETYGSIIYQEQVMNIGRHVGALSWEDVSTLRKAMSKSLGEEYFNNFWLKFWAGAKEKGIPEEDARAIWDKMCTFGSWAFNKSHAVSYGIISYWCAVLKAHHPMEFAAACLKHAKDEDQSIKILQEIVNAGFEYKAIDPELSEDTWSVQNGILVGGLQGIKGIGPALSKDIMKRRQEGRELTPRQKKLLRAGKTPFDDVFEGKNRFGDIYENPVKYNIRSGRPMNVKDIQDNGEYVFLAKIKETNLRDHNEALSVNRRGYKMTGQTIYLNMVLEDDTGQILATINRRNYRKMGLPIIERGEVGTWYLWKGTIDNDWRKINVKKLRRLG